MRNVLGFRLLIALITGALSLALVNGASAQFAFQTCYDVFGNAYQIQLPESCAQAGLSTTPGSAFAAYQTCYDASGNAYQEPTTEACFQVGLSTVPGTVTTGTVTTLGTQTCYDASGGTQQIPATESCAQAGLATTPAVVVTASYQTCYDSFGNAYQVPVGQACATTTTVGQLGISCNGVFYANTQSCPATTGSPVSILPTACVTTPTVCRSS